MYCTLDLVRKKSGLTNSSNVADTRIKGAIIRACAMVDGYLVGKYQMPLAYRRAVPVTFSGTGTGTGTLNVVINGVTYGLSITSGLTASAAADLLRAAILEDESVFLPELSGSGTEVLLVSRTDSSDLTTANTETTVTGGAQSGITATVGTKFSRYPQLIEELSADIASNMLLMDNFGIEEEGTTRDGMAKIALSEQTLKQIQGTDNSMSSIRVLDEVTGEEIALSGKPVVRGYPNVASDDAGDTNLEFSVNSRF